MKQKTNVTAEEGKQEIVVERVFELPVALLYKAYTEPELVEQWMGNKVLKLENKAHGGYQFETVDERGNVLFKAHGTIHSVEENRNITRTFEMAGFPAQLEFLDFESLGAESSKLRMQMVFRSVADRDNLLKMPFAAGVNMAHNRLEEAVGQLKSPSL